MTILDYLALCLFGLLWFAFSWITGQGRIFSRTSLTQAMAERRRQWILNSLGRDLKMIDTQILSGLQNGTAFFASTSIFAIGGCFALLGQTDQVDAILKDLPFVAQGGRATFEIKIFFLAAILGYSFFKFGWSYRLFNYCTILFGALPMTAEAHRDPEGAARAAELTIRMNIIAAGHFNAGLRALFMSIGYLGWFASPYLFIGTSLTVFFVLLRRQFFSEARLALLETSQHSP
ncbi:MULTISPECIES: DUF599 domain-containing protein [Alphaproteobacteria]|uniref:Membrane protein n=2 Tax=Alphaproteobacteria TaxID=28211 RepID=A0A512HDA3_9HYPH|nr:MULTISPECIES: DUF599 family protein [Alphaproteobacteria]GEO83426.1 membrane protein [Ciceribacter naphthalenivorans]GLR23001.1 membrane protein [Ciceribacter naphthalenivorans]GLT05857.1 membrane protein [Sphingomonas psychrolutea]